MVFHNQSGVFGIFFFLNNSWIRDGIVYPKVHLYDSVLYFAPVLGTPNSTKATLN